MPRRRCLRALSPRNPVARRYPENGRAGFRQFPLRQRRRHQRGYSQKTAGQGGARHRGRRLHLQHSAGNGVSRLPGRGQQVHREGDHPQSPLHRRYPEICAVFAEKHRYHPEQSGGGRHHGRSGQRDNLLQQECRKAFCRVGSGRYRQKIVEYIPPEYVRGRAERRGTPGNPSPYGAWRRHRGELQARFRQWQRYRGGRYVQHDDGHPEKG